MQFSECEPFTDCEGLEAGAAPNCKGSGTGDSGYQEGCRGRYMEEARKKPHEKGPPDKHLRADEK